MYAKKKRLAKQNLRVHRVSTEAAELHAISHDEAQSAVYPSHAPCTLNLKTPLHAAPIQAPGQQQNANQKLTGAMQSATAHLLPTGGTSGAPGIGAATAAAAAAAAAIAIASGAAGAATTSASVETTGAAAVIASEVTATGAASDIATVCIGAGAADDVIGIIPTEAAAAEAAAAAAAAAEAAASAATEEVVGSGAADIAGAGAGGGGRSFIAGIIKVLPAVPAPAAAIEAMSSFE